MFTCLPHANKTLYRCLVHLFCQYNEVKIKLNKYVKTDVFDFVLFRYTIPYLN